MDGREEEAFRGWVCTWVSLPLYKLKLSSVSISFTLIYSTHTFKMQLPGDADVLTVKTMGWV